MRANACVIPTLLALSIAPALAGDFYALGAAGRSSFRDGKNPADSAQQMAGAANVLSSQDKHGTGYKLQLGYQFNPNLAVEGGYVDLGKQKYAASFAGGTASATAKTYGGNIAGVGIAPISDQFSLFGKLGIVAAKVEVDATAAGPAGTATTRAKAVSVKPNYGLGAAYNFSKTVGMRAEFERFQKLGDTGTTGETTSDLFSLGVAVKF